MSTKDIIFRTRTWLTYASVIGNLLSIYPVHPVDFCWSQAVLQETSVAVMAPVFRRGSAVMPFKIVMMDQTKLIAVGQTGCLAGLLNGVPYSTASTTSPFHNTRS